MIEMMRTCPRCGDYYADVSLAFCLADGTPLAKVEPLAENWSEGTRVIEEKENALRKQRRRLKWRRVVLRAMTMLMLAMVLCVVAVNSFIYLRPKREETVLATPLTPATAAAKPFISITSPTPAEIPPASSPTPIATPIHVYKISGRVTDGSKAIAGVRITLGGAKSISITTDANGHYTFNGLPAGGRYTITPASAEMDFKPPGSIIKNLTADKSADFVGTVEPKCSVADKGLEKEIILNTYRNKWRRNIEGDRSKILAANRPIRVENPRGLSGFANVDAALGEIEYDISFPKACTAFVTAEYVWQVKTEGTQSAPGKVFTVPYKRRFACTKTVATWICR